MRGKRELNRLAWAQQIIDEATEPWGVKVTIVEVRDAGLPPEMIRAMARQAEAERERRAKIIHAEGEFQAAEKLADAGKVMAATPTTLRLRYLQTLTEISTEQQRTVIFPVPLDLVSALAERGPGYAATPARRWLLVGEPAPPLADQPASGLPEPARSP